MRKKGHSVKVWDGTTPPPAGYVLILVKYGDKIVNEPWYEEAIYDISDPDDFPGAVFIPRERYIEYKSRIKNE